MIISGDPKLICTAYVKARGEMSATVTKDAKGNFGKYATLAAIVEASTPSFAKHGLAIVQEASADDGAVCIETWLIHESGATMQFSPLTMPLADRKPQTVGSAISYARRYALTAICGLATDDDDGQAAQDSTKGTQRAPAASKGQQRSHVADEVFDEPRSPLATKAQVQELGALGLEFYADEWSEQAATLAQAVSKGDVADILELTQSQIAKLINGIRSKMAQVAEAQS